MTASNYLALLFGIYILAVSIPMITSQKRLVSMMDEYIESPPLIFLTGVLALIGGISIIFFHNIWTADWRSVVTLMGWVAAIEGIVLIAFPDPLIRFAKSILNKSPLISVLGFAYVALGAFFISRALLY